MGHCTDGHCILGCIVGQWGSKHCLEVEKTSAQRWPTHNALQWPFLEAEMQTENILNQQMCACVCVYGGSFLDYIPDLFKGSVPDFFGYLVETFRYCSDFFYISRFSRSS